MKLLLNVYRSNENADGFDCAILDLTPQLAAEILLRMNLFAELRKRDKDLAEMGYHDCSPSFLSGDVEQLAEILDYGEDYKEADIEGTPVQDFEVERTECDRMVIHSGEVYWEAIPKHGDWRVETRPIQEDLIRKVIAAAEVPV